MSTITIWSLLSTSVTSLLYEVTLKHRCILECSILLLVQLPLQFPHGGIKHAQLRASLGCAIQKHGWLSMAFFWDGSSTPPYHSSQSVLLPTRCSSWASGCLLQVFLSLSDWGQGGALISDFAGLEMIGSAPDCALWGSADLRSSHMSGCAEVQVWGIAVHLVRTSF